MRMVEDESSGDVGTPQRARHQGGGQGRRAVERQRGCTGRVTKPADEIFFVERSRRRPLQASWSSARVRARLAEPAVESVDASRPLLPSSGSGEGRESRREVLREWRF